MKILTSIVALLLLGGATRLQALSGVIWDEVVVSIDNAERELAAGEDRKGILERLNRVIERNTKSVYYAYASDLSADLAFSLKEVGDGQIGEKRSFGELMDSKFPFYLAVRSTCDLAYQPKCDSYLERFMNDNPHDTMTVIFRKDRSVIGSLLPLLNDISPTRCYPVTGEVPSRVGERHCGVPHFVLACDMAIMAIEFHSKCRFNYKASSGYMFHDLTIEDRAKTIHRIEDWWNEVKTKSVGEGIRAQIPHADFREKLLMAQNLAQLGGEDSKSDRLYATELLKKLVQENVGDTAIEAASALANIGDFSPVDIFYDRLKDTLGKTEHGCDSSMVYYLTDHGTRREWELLNKLAQEEINRGIAAGNAKIWVALVNCSKAESSPLAIPGLALALSQTQCAGNRVVNNISQDISYADFAIEHLQKVAKIDFGYHLNDSEGDRAAAIRRAQAWWKAEGIKKYSFDSAQPR